MEGGDFCGNALFQEAAETRLRPCQQLDGSGAIVDLAQVRLDVTQHGEAVIERGTITGPEQFERVAKALGLETEAMQGAGAGRRAKQGAAGAEVLTSRLGQFASGIFRGARGNIPGDRFRFRHTLETEAGSPSRGEIAARGASEQALEIGMESLRLPAHAKGERGIGRKPGFFKQFERDVTIADLAGNLHDPAEAGANLLNLPSRKTLMEHDETLLHAADGDAEIVDGIGIVEAGGAIHTKRQAAQEEGGTLAGEFLDGHRDLLKTI